MVCLHSLHAVYHSVVMVIHAGHIMKDKVAGRRKLCKCDLPFTWVIKLEFMFTLVIFLSFVCLASDLWTFG